MIRSVLVAVDGSEPGGRALDLAGGIAAKCDAALTLLHVQAHPAHGGVPSTPPTVGLAYLEPY